MSQAGQSGPLIGTDRQVRLVDVDEDGAIIACGHEGAHLRVGLIPTRHGRHVLSLRGLGCLVGIANSRPIAAVQVGSDCEVVLQAGRRDVGRAWVRFAPLDGTMVRLPPKAVVVIDLGADGDYFVLTRTSP